MLVIDGVQIVIDSVVEKELRSEILDKVSFLLSCVKGSIPMNRDVGIDPDAISKQAYISKNLYTISAIELIEKYEPRVSVEEITFETVGNGEKIIPKVVLTYNGE